MAPYMARQPMDCAAYMTYGFDSTFECEQETYTMTAVYMSRKGVYKRRRGAEVRSNTAAASIEKDIDETSANKVIQRPSYTSNISISTQAALMTRQTDLAKLSKQVRKLEEDLEKTLDVQKNVFKWKWSNNAMAIVQKLRDLANGSEDTNLTLVGSKLDEILLEWPEEKFNNPDWFFDASTPDFEDWDRPKNWFAKKDCTLHRAPYTFPNQWNKLPLEAVFIVPDDLSPGSKVPIMWYFHGGGFCTSAADHIPFSSGKPL
jgi:hypothetical protein